MRTKTRVHLPPDPRATNHPCGSRSHHGSASTDNVALVTCRGCQGYLLQEQMVEPLFGPAHGDAVTAARSFLYRADSVPGGLYIHFWLLDVRKPRYSELAALVLLAKKLLPKDIVGWTYCKGSPAQIHPSRKKPSHQIEAEQAVSLATTIPLPLLACPSKGGDRLRLETEHAKKTLLDAPVNPKTPAWDAAWALLEQRARKWMGEPAPAP